MRKLTNADIADLLATEAEKANYPIQRALRRAGRSAFLWPIEASEMIQQKRALTELRGIGPYIEKIIKRWLEHPPEQTQREEIRRNFFTWPQAQKILAGYPDWRSTVCGDLQMHTQWSDGSGTIRSMAEAAIPRGYQYIAITDHAKRLKIAGGIDEKELQEQGREITALNEELAGQGFRILRSIELNLDTKGNGDMEPEALAKLDVVLGAFHSSLRRTEDQTERYLAAICNPHVHILGHPRGRIYNYRLGLRADWDRVFELAARLGKAVEIDCYPDRQDMSIDLIEKARKAGLRISIGTDSHHPWQLEFIDLGLAAALSAGVPKEKIINFLTAEELLQWARESGDQKPVERRTPTFARRRTKQSRR